jgi:hypothetical protein
MFADFQTVKDWIELISSCVVLFGVPLGLYQYYKTKRKEQIDREYGTYNALDEKFLEYQTCCLDHPQLDVFDVPDASPAQLTSEQKKQELIIFTMLFAIFERAYLMYFDQATEIKERQWTGWNEYIRSFGRRANFKSAWQASGATFDKEFEKYMQDAMR